MYTPSEQTYDHVLGLRAVRGYLDRPIEDEHLERILQAGRWTGSAKNIQPWAFIVIRDEESRKELAGCGTFTTPILLAPLVVVIVRTPDGGDFDMGRVAQNMMLAAASMDIASCPVTLHDQDCARQLLGVPEDHGCRWAVTFGYPDEAEHQQQREQMRAFIGGGRKPLVDLVHEETFNAGR